MAPTTLSILVLLLLSPLVLLSSIVVGATFFNKEKNLAPPFLLVQRGGGGTAPTDSDTNENSSCPGYGRLSDTEYRLTPEQIEAFHRDGCITISNVLTEEEVLEIEVYANKLLSGEISVPGKDFCDMSKPFGTPMEEWSLVNAMLPTKYCPSLKGNVYERLSLCMARQLFPHSGMTQDYDQLLNKLPSKQDAVFAWHSDMAYWPSARLLGLNHTDTCTFSLALDDSDEANGCLRYVVGSGVSKTLREHGPLCGDRDKGHALTATVGPDEEVRLAPAKRGSITIHDEWVVHGSAGNTCHDRQRRTYVIAYRSKDIVEAERRLGFTHSHNDEKNWDTFNDGEPRRVKQNEQKS